MEELLFPPCVIELPLKFVPIKRLKHRAAPALSPHDSVVVLRLCGEKTNCVSLFLRPSDEDMQSLASLMSMKQADIGNLDDFEEENEEDEENKVNQEEKAAKITGETRFQCQNFVFPNVKSQIVCVPDDPARITFTSTIYTHTHTHIVLYIHICSHNLIKPCTHTYMQFHKYIHKRASTYIFIYSLYIYILYHVHTHIHIYVYTHMHTHTITFTYSHFSLITTS